jgi:hypothetical protein
MARIFQKYVTPEGLTDAPPGDEPPKEDINRVVTSGGVGLTKVGGSSVTMESLLKGFQQGKDAVDEQEQKTPEITMESVMPIYMVLTGIRNIIQSLNGMKSLTGRI